MEEEITQGAVQWKDCIFCGPSDKKQELKMLKINPANFIKNNVV